MKMAETFELRLKMSCGAAADAAVARLHGKPHLDVDVGDQQRELLVDSERSSASSSASTATGSQPMAAFVAALSAHDVSAFCKGFGLPDEVCKNFVDNCVDYTMLLELGDADLMKELGMTKLQVKRLRRELKALHGGE